MAGISPSLLIVLAAAAAGLLGYVMLVLVPVVRSYGRAWERVAAGVLSLFILAALLLVGAALGVAVVLSYDRFS